MRPIFQGLSVSLLALTVAGCTTAKPVALDRAGDVPPAFTAPVADANAPIWPDVSWWNNFQAAELPALIEKAQAENLDIAAAAARVLQAEAGSTIAFANMLPTVGASFQPQRSGTSAVTSNAFRATFSGSYVIDYLGENMNGYRAARESLRAARYSQTVTGLFTQSAVAETYFNILALREHIAITRQNIEAAKRLLTITQAKFNSGVSSNLDVAQEQATVSRQEGRLPGLIESERQARYAMAILLGLPPEGFDVKAQNLDGIASPNVKAGVPSELLARRPDIAQAEANLYAAHANVDAARAAYFPQIGIDGSAGWGSAIIGSLINPGNFAWSVGASVAQTIFDGGAINARNQSARARQTELIANYRKTVFTAFSDVESAMGNVQSNNERLGYTIVEARSAQEAFRISELQYREGTIDITALLTAQQSLFTAQESLVDSRLSRLLSNVQLYIALGGGWQQQQADESYKTQLDWWPL